MFYIEIVQFDQKISNCKRKKSASVKEILNLEKKAIDKQKPIYLQG